VSIIKGDQNIVPNIPITTNNYSFVYNTDPEDNGNTSITLPYIIPTAVSGGMTIDWGDGSPIRPYNKGVVPSHDYPYPGQYRIQISGNETWDPAGNITGTLTGGGFDSARLGTGDKIINRVDQWAPQHRVGASGPGFTGDDMHRLLISQVANKFIPPFKYTNLTSLEYTFYNQQFVETNGWDWVPTELQECTTMQSCYRAISLQRVTPSAIADKAAFPQMITSDKLLKVNGCFDFGPKGWVDKDNKPTLFPWTNTSKVTDFSFAFSNSSFTEIGPLNMSSAENASNMFAGCPKLTAIPYFNFNKLKNASSMFRDCSNVTSIPATLDFSTVTDLRSCFREMTSLPSFPTTYNFDNVTLASSAWRELKGCSTLPDFDLPSCLNMSEAFYNCTNLTSFPTPTSTNLVSNWNYCWGGSIGLPTSFPNTVDISGGTDFFQTWEGAKGLTSFPADLDFTKATNMSGTWLNCSSLTSFPTLTKPPAAVTKVDSAWQNCKKLTSFPAFPFSSCNLFERTWRQCDLLANFEPNQFDTTGTLKPTAFNNAFQQCALTPASIENILVSLDTNGQSNIVLGIDAGTNAAKSTWTAAANTAYDNLIAKGWTITFNA